MQRPQAAATGARVLRCCARAQGGARNIACMHPVCVKKTLVGVCVCPGASRMVCLARRARNQWGAPAVRVPQVGCPCSVCVPHASTLPSECVVRVGLRRQPALDMTVLAGLLASCCREKVLQGAPLSGASCVPSLLLARGRQRALNACGGQQAPCHHSAWLLASFSSCNRCTQRCSAARGTQAMKMNARTRARTPARAHSPAPTASKRRLPPHTVRLRPNEGTTLWACVGSRLHVAPAWPTPGRLCWYRRLSSPVCCTRALTSPPAVPCARTAPA